MNNQATNLVNMTEEKKRLLLKQLLARKEQVDGVTQATGEISEEYYRVDKFPGFRLLMEQTSTFKALATENPYFSVHEGVSDHITSINGKDYINYSGYNYLGLSGHPDVSAGAKAAIDQYGTSVSASRIVSGEIPLHRELEQALAHIHGTEDAVALVSGYSTNVAVIGHLFGPNDLLLHDSLIHNSVITGCQLSGARRLAFPHNDWQALDSLLEENRSQHQRVLIIVEGVYSMDGDIPDLPRFIEVKNRHKCLLMVDEAHAAGVIGSRGFGSRDHFGIDASEVDIWMGTLSKSFASCGGYICGSKALVDNLKYNAPGAVLFSVGISPANTGAALAAANIMIREPERAVRLRARAALFLERAKLLGLDTGPSAGTAVVPIILGNSMRCLKLGQKLAQAGINVHPIMYPAVPEAASRLRFFITSNLTETEVIYTVDTLAKELAVLA
ncbi:aminotransferase class I/II-fold pyridoxal phosphate-dependent enzyme [Methylomonas albis]|uniref:8-amino-7-oxononanoate synthase n=1 Tax=Methylomonas albis TaxID=1854563 RepID=A0ABR9D2T8_9GAMM|nr:aminotransferase class I/II-fold pyridoxal phosphate-dependent enzyme [Methylomonas albis]MBD9357360.1 aminotransferase class I/II-fold pyridoxal phosphate-dependent enzyme [Methylomonas albis]